MKLRRSAGSSAGSLVGVGDAQLVFADGTVLTPDPALVLDEAVDVSAASPLRVGVEIDVATHTVVAVRDGAGRLVGEVPA